MYTYIVIKSSTFSYPLKRHDIISFQVSVCYWIVQEESCDKISKHSYFSCDNFVQYSIFGGHLKFLEITRDRAISIKFIDPQGCKTRVYFHKLWWATLFLAKSEVTNMVKIESNSVIVIKFLTYNIIK